MKTWIKNSKDLRKQLLHLVWILLVLILMILSVSLFSNRIRSSILEREMWQTEQAAHYISKIAMLEIERCQDVLSTTKYQFDIAQKKDPEKLTEKLAVIRQAENSLYHVGLMDLEGNAIYDDGTTHTIENPALKQAIQNGENYISNRLETNISEENSLQLAVPLEKDDQITGAMIGYYRISRIADILGLTDNSLRYFQIIDKSGAYISRNDSNYSFAEDLPLWEELKRYELSGLTIDELQENLEKGKSGTFFFSYQGQGRYVSYEPLGINDWYIFSVLVETGIDGFTSEIGLHFERFLIWFSVLALVLFGAILVSDKKQQRIIQKQNQELTVKNKLFDMILDKSKDIPFEIDLPQKKLTLLYSEQMRQQADQQVWEDFSPQRMLATGQIRQETYQKYQRLYDAIFSGGEIPQPILEMNLDGQWRWVKVNILHATEEKLVGFLEDFDVEMKQRKIIEKANQQIMIDELTGLYRRESCIKLVQQRQRQNPVGAFFLIDLDGFKEVNDTLGHSQGDQALRNAAKAMKRITRKDDIVGRLGGDEFVVYLSGISKLEDVQSCAQKMNDALRCTYADGRQQVQVSASIGIAVHSGETSFPELYEKADKELYRVKQSQKDGYHIVTV